jgi:ADP-ribose pyrophosphatase
MKIVFEGDRVLVIERGHWQYVERKKGKSAVAVLALTEDDRLIFTDQYRQPVSSRVIDWPAGLVGDEDPSISAADTAKKELEEETGYVCESVELLTEGPTSPGITSERVSFFRARGVTRKNDGGGVEGEDITVHAIPRRDVVKWLEEQRQTGALIDLKVWSGLYFLSSK